MYSITELIPQRPPIVMVDEFLGIEDGTRSRTRFTVRADNLFVADGVLDECGVIEHVAQSAAARVGYLCLGAGRDIALGYIGSVNDFRLFSHPKTGDVIETEMDVIQEVFNITLVEAHCRVDGECVASCRMKIFLDDEQA